MAVRLLSVLALVSLTVGCKNGPLTTENLFGNRTTVPPPATGTASTTPPYDPFAPTLPQTAPAVTPSPSGAAPATGGTLSPTPPGNFTPPAGYAPPGGSYQTPSAQIADPRSAYAFRYGQTPGGPVSSGSVSGAMPPAGTLSPVGGSSAGAAPTEPGGWRQPSASLEPVTPATGGASTRRGASPDDAVAFAGAPMSVNDQHGDVGDSGVHLASAEMPEGHSDSVRQAGSELPVAGDDPAAANRLYAHHPQFRWVQGRLDYSERDAAWRIRYRPVGQEDELGGVLWLRESGALEGFQAGDFVAIQGSLVETDPSQPVERPEYEIERIRPLGS